MNYFTEKNFLLFSNIIFNIFPRINSVTLENCTNGDSDFYHLKLHKNDNIHQIEYDDNKKIEFFDNDVVLEKPIYLSHISYVPRTNKTYCIKRKKETEPYVYDIRNIAIKFFPLMKFCNFESIHICNDRVYFYTSQKRYTIYENELKVYLGYNDYIFNINEISAIVKMMLNGENNEQNS